MAEDHRKDYRSADEEDEDMIAAERMRGSGLIFVLIAIALILAIGFFYLTKEDRREPPDSVAPASNSAAYIVGEGAKNAADTLRNKDR